MELPIGHIISPRQAFKKLLICKKFKYAVSSGPLNCGEKKLKSLQKLGNENKISPDISDGCKADANCLRKIFRI